MKPAFILDCSVTMAWCFEDETCEYSENVINTLQKKDAIVPPLWPLEVTNVLLIAERKKRISHLKSTAFKELLNQLPIHVDQNATVRCFGSVMELAREQQLTSYDASYLEIALLNKLPIATLDKAIKQAAKKIDVTIYQP